MEKEVAKHKSRVEKSRKGSSSTAKEACNCIEDIVSLPRSSLNCWQPVSIRPVDDLC